MLKRILLASTLLASGSIFVSAKPPEGGPHERGPRMSPEERFAKLDSDSDDFLTAEEFAKNPRLQDKEDEEITKIFQHFDTDKNDKISLEEYKEGKKMPPPGEHPDRPKGERPGLISLDTDEDGKVSLEEFQASPRSKEADPEKVKEFFERLDKDDDGFLADDELHRGEHPKHPKGEKPAN